MLMMANIENLLFQHKLTEMLHNCWKLLGGVKGKVLFAFNRENVEAFNDSRHI